MTDSTSTLPPQAAQAASSALESALNSQSTDPHNSASGPNPNPIGNSTDSSNSNSNSNSNQEESESNSNSNPTSSDSKQPITVFQDPNNFNVKHPLYNRWTLWFDNPSQKGASKGSKESWGEDLNQVISFDSVEEFWGLYNNVIAPSELPARANYYLFKEGIKPAWEDPANGSGGKWSIQLPRDKTRAKIDQIWLYTMLSAIGETLEQPFESSNSSTSSNEEELITGVIMAARPHFYRVAVWTSKAEETLEDGEKASQLSRRLMDIGKQFKVGVLGYTLEQRVASSLGTEVEFQSHTESEKKRGKKTSL